MTDRPPPDDLEPPALPRRVSTRRAAAAKTEPPLADVRPVRRRAAPRRAPVRPADPREQAPPRAVPFDPTLTGTTEQQIIRAFDLNAPAGQPSARELDLDGQVAAFLARRSHGETAVAPRMREADGVLTELNRLCDRVPHVTGGLVATCDGFLVACDLPAELEPEGMAAVVATELSLSHRVASAVHEGDFEEVVIRSGGGHVAIYAAGRNAALAILAGPEVSLGRLHLEARPAARAIAGLMPELSRPTERMTNVQS